MSGFVTNEQRKRFAAIVKRWLQTGYYTVQGRHVAGHSYSSLLTNVRDDWRRGGNRLAVGPRFELLLDEAGFKIVEGVNNRNAPCRVVVEKEPAATH